MDAPAAVLELHRALRSSVPDIERARSATELILRDIREARAVVAGLRHPLGFYYVPLARWSTWALRIHLWPAQPRWQLLTTSPYHRHKWKMVSYVHQGQVKNTIMGVRSPVDEPRFRLFEIAGSGPVDTLTPTEEIVEPYIISEQTVPSGGWYEMEAGVFHTSTSDPDRWSVTSALVERDGRFTERAIGPIGLGQHDTRRQAVDRAELAEVCAEVLREVPS